MMIRPATALRNNYDSMVKLSTEKQEPIYLTRNGEGEMVFLPIDLWEKETGGVGTVCGNAAQGTEQAGRLQDIFCF